MPKILFVAAHRPDRSPAQRFRFEQYLPFLKEKGFDYDFSFLISESDDKVFYQPGNFFTKSYIFFKSFFRRLNDVLRANKYDLIFIQREAFMTGVTFFEKLFKHSKAKVIYDFDDAIWHFDVSEGNKNLGWLKNPGKTARIISLADLVFAGNQYLLEYAQHHNDHVVIIPTTIDTNEYVKQKVTAVDNVICIGWSGSHTTIRHFEMAESFLALVKQKFGDAVRIKVIGDNGYRNDALGIQGIDWNKKDELKELNEIDIGIMPVPNDEWSKGKCGLKGLQYMALEIPTIMSPVGVNSEIIEHGVNGFLASSDKEWFEIISQLIADKNLREKTGNEARKTVVEKYSVESQKYRYLEYFSKLIYN